MLSLTEELVAAILDKYGADLPKLNLSNNGIHSVQGMQRFSQVTQLNLAGNKIVDLSPLSPMKQLVHLNLAENKICDLTPLSPLVRLEFLDVSGNGLCSLEETLRALAPLKALNTLHLRGNPMNAAKAYDAAIVFQTLTAVQWLDDRERDPLIVAAAPARDEALSTIASDASTKRKIASLEAQLLAMERAFTVQERVLAAPQPSRTADSDKYFSLVQSWRKQCLLLLVEKFHAERHLRDALGDKERSRDAMTHEVVTLEASLLSANERLGALSTQVAGLREQLVTETANSAALIKARASTMESSSSHRATLEAVRRIVEEAHRRSGVSVDVIQLSQAAAALEGMERRLVACSERIKLAQSIVAMKEVKIRNTAAAFEAEKSLWLHENMRKGEGTGREPTARDECLSDVRIRPEVEAFLRSLFKRLDGADSGVVSTSDLLGCIDTAESNPLHTIVERALGEEVTAALRKELTKTEESLTWGELLLLVYRSSLEPLPELPRTPLTREDLLAMEVGGLWGDAEWALIPLALPADSKVLRRKVEPIDYSHLTHERAFLLRKCQDMQRTLERRAEAIKAHFANDLKIQALREKGLESKVMLLEERLALFEASKSESDASTRDLVASLQVQLGTAHEENGQLRQRIELMRDSEGSLIDRRLAEELSRYAKLDTEYKLLKREQSKTEVKCKSLMRDMLRLQVTASANADAMVGSGAEKQALLDDVSRLSLENTLLTRRLNAMTESQELALLERERAETGVRELTAKNAELQTRASALEQELLISGLRGKSAETASIGVNTESTSDVRDSRAIESCTVGAASSYPYPSRDIARESSTKKQEQQLLDKESYATQSEFLDANIARLARLADALLGHD